jgi:hypothetical protein
MRCRTKVGTLALLVLAGCGGSEGGLGGGGAVSGTPTTSSAPDGTSLAPTSAAPSTVSGGETGFQSCADVPEVQAPADWYRDRPVYVGGEQPVNRVRAWARGRPGYQEIWLDNEHFGWITVAFTSGAVARQAELEAQFPDVGVVAVEVPTASGDLRALQRRVGRLMEDAGIEYAGSGSGNTKWMVEVYVNAADPRLSAALAPLAGERICLEDMGVPVAEGPQPGSGDGWRLLGDELVGEVYRTDIATTDDQYRELWKRVAMTAPRPAVDFASEVVVWFGAVYGSTCPIRLDDVVVDNDTDRPLLYPVIVVPGGTGVCTSDARPHSYFVAIERDHLPAGPFAIQLSDAVPPPGVPEERTLVDADLSTPGAIATADQVGPDRALIKSSRQPQPAESGGYIEPGYPSPYRFFVHCGVAVLGQLNGIWWMTDARGVPIPHEWASRVDRASDTITVDVVITPGPDPTATATLNGRSVVYHPVKPDTVPGCD